MSNFLQKLTAKFKLFVETQWHDATESKRLDFNFLPEAMALDLLKHVKAHPIHTRFGLIPLILRNQDKDDSIILDDCNGQELRDDQILRLRNNHPTCLVGVRPGEILEKSLDSDSVPNPFEELKEDLFEGWFPNNKVLRQKFEKLLGYVTAPRNSKVRDEILCRKKWAILQALHDLEVQDCNQPHKKSLAILGGIFIPDAGDVPDMLKSMHKCLGSIGKQLEDGIETAFTDWKSKARDNGVKQALDEFKAHLFRNNIDGATFAASPSLRYCPFPDNFSGQVEIPNWWINLDLETWSELLYEAPPPRARQLSLKVTNAIYLDSLGINLVPENETPKLELSGQPPHDEEDEEENLETVTWKRDETRLEENGGAQYEDNAVASHPKPIKYEAEVTGDSAFCKVVTISEFVHGILVDVPRAKRLSFPSEQNGALKANVEMHSTGRFNVKVHHASSITVVKVVGKDISREQEGGEQEFPFTSVTPTLDTFEMETDEDSTWEIHYHCEDGVKRLYILPIKAEDQESATLVRTEYDCLVAQHVEAPRKIPEVDASINDSTLSLLGHHQILLEKSWYPIPIADDILEADLRNIDNWETHDFTKIPFFNDGDPRPAFTTFSIPEKLVDSMGVLLGKDKLIAEVCEADNQIPEAAKLSEIYLDEEKRQAVTDYISAFRSWLEDEPEKAKWFFTLPVFESRESYLGGEPTAILVSPLHPLRLGWHLHAQGLMQDEINRGFFCPVADEFSPAKIPDFLEIDCLDPSGESIPATFVSISTSSSYWGLLWNIAKIERLGDPWCQSLFLNGLGLEVSGLSRGLDASQVKKSMKEAVQLGAGRTSLDVKISVAEGFDSGCNDGILDWVRDLANNKKESEGDHKLLKCHAPSCVSVFDSRPIDQMPSVNVIADVAAMSNYQFTWGKDREVPADLHLLTNLKSQNRKVAPDPSSRSAVSHGFLLNKRMRTMIGSGTLKETLIPEAAHKEGIDETSLMGSLHHCLVALSGDAEKSLLYAPLVQDISHALQADIFCALTSDSIDSGFLGNVADQAVLWDFQYADYTRNREGGGFYLLTSERPEINQVLQQATRHICDNEESLGEETLNLLLREFGQRGLPNLHKLSESAVSAAGEISTLAAMRILQPRVPVATESFPFPANGSPMNFLLPLDPYKDRINYVRGKRHMKLSVMTLPDLLAISLCGSGDDQDPFRVKFTPIEVKFRSGICTRNERRVALRDQAQEFAKFLEKLKSHQPESELWRLLFNSLVAEFLSRAFSLLGHRDPETVRLQSRLIHAALFGKIAVDIDQRGRLIVLDDSNVTKSRDLDDDGFKETFVINRSEGAQILSSPERQIPRVNEELEGGDWELQCCQGEDSPVSADLPEPELTPTEVLVESHNDAQETPQLPEVRTPDASDDQGGEIEEVASSSSSGMGNELIEALYNRILAVYDEFEVRVRRPERDVIPYVEGPASLLFKLSAGDGVSIRNVTTKEGELKLKLELRENQGIRFLIDEGYVKIEVPKKNEFRYFIKAEELWREWAGPHNGKLTVPIGKDMHGGIVELDFSSSNTPHLLIAGATGQGKTTALDAILTGLIRHKSEGQLQLFLWDGKGNELIGYEEDPHVQSEIGNSIDDAIELLQSSVREMNNRYQLMRNARKRDIKSYNEDVSPDQRLPWLLIVLDEYARLVTATESQEKRIIEDNLKQIAQMGRSCGIHLILSTQRPDANVVDPVIRDQLGAQLALTVRDQTASRIIIGESGAEKLNGRGEAILRTPEQLTRLQCAYIEAG